MSGLLSKGRHGAGTVKTLPNVLPLKGSDTRWYLKQRGPVCEAGSSRQDRYGLDVSTSVKAGTAWPALTTNLRVSFLVVPGPPGPAAVSVRRRPRRRGSGSACRRGCSCPRG